MATENDDLVEDEPCACGGTAHADDALRTVISIGGKKPDDDSDAAAVNLCRNAS
jgi:hypothetical protein